MELVVGLGNPGPRYADTRHNVGFMVVDALARQLAGAGWTLRELPGTAPAEVLEARPPGAGGAVEAPGPGLWLVKPLTYMNLSGEALAALGRVRSFSPAACLLVVDDIYLPFGRLRLRKGGTDGGHNGLTSVHATLGTLEVPRLRCGVGPVPAGADMKEFVTEPFAAGEREELDDFIDRAVRVVRAALEKGVAAAQNEVALVNTVAPDNPVAPAKTEGVEDA